MILITGLTVEYAGVTALADIDLQVESGEFVTVVGPSGCGKTTLLRVIGGLEAPTEGRVEIDGETPAAAQSAGDVGYVFQRRTLMPWKTALENVTFLRRAAAKPPDRDDARQRLGAVGLSSDIDSYPSALSGGQRQRVAIARAVHLGASVLLMDEPFGHLDELTRYEMSEHIQSVRRATDATVVFVTHSVPEAVLLGDRCVVMSDRPGRICDVREILLPRPRDTSTLSSDRFQSTVAAIRAELYE